MYIKRLLEKRLNEFAKFPVVAILGPRQSGKTTLAQAYFKKHKYFNLEDPITRATYRNDPHAFLQTHENKYGIIFDEFQNEPELLSYIQVISDQKDRPGYFILTGSQNYLSQRQPGVAHPSIQSLRDHSGRAGKESLGAKSEAGTITQSLAGRVAIITLLPLSIQELIKAKLLRTYDEHILNGFYPRFYAKRVTREIFYSSYLQTYIEKDVRLVIAEHNLMTFQLFLKLCAGRVGQQLNKSELATQCGVDLKVITQWLSHLQASYIIFLLPAYYKNYNKRLTKTPKLYFFDTGLVSFLLGIDTQEELLMSPFRGPLFENLIIADFYKQYYQTVKIPNLYYWRDLNGRLEVDCLIDRVATIVPIEIKASETFVPRFFDAVTDLSELAKIPAQTAYVVYAGTHTLATKNGTLMTWQRAGTLIPDIFKRASQK